MKKIIALVCSFLLAFALTACGNKSNVGNDISNGMSSIGSTIESAADDLTGNSSQSTSKAKITEDEAKATALKHAGVDEANITGLDIDLEHDNGVLKYDVDFHSNGVEYDYDINAETGDIISSNKDHD